MKFKPGRGRRFAAALIIPALALLFLYGCASGPAGYGEEVSDPFEKVNRKIFSFNQGADRFITRPLAKGYKFIMPDIFEKGVHNFFVNLRTPVEAANSLLQGKPGDAAISTGRFVLNSTLGFGGLIDVATDAGINRRQEDFAQTLAVWGVPSGPYLMLPFAGPASLRDAVAEYGESYGVPIYENGWSLDNTSVRDKLIVLRIIDLRAGLIGPDEKINAAFDPYAFLRSAFAQRRDFLIYDGDPPEEEFDDEEFEDE